MSKFFGLEVSLTILFYEGCLNNWLTTRTTLLMGNAMIFCLALIVKARFALQRQGVSSITLHLRLLQSEIAEWGMPALS